MAGRTRQVSLADLAERSIVTAPKALTVVPAVSSVAAPPAEPDPPAATPTTPAATTPAAPVTPAPIVEPVADEQSVALEAVPAQARPLQENVAEPARVERRAAAHRSPVPPPAAAAEEPVGPGGSGSDSSSAPAPGEWVRYDRLERKEIRLRADQYSSLTDVSRGLNRVRAGQGERITENTLIRIAIDLLLAEGDKLRGTTEARLRNSVGL